MSNEQQNKKRGRPPKVHDNKLETRELLLRAGLEVLTEKGFSAAGLDEILKRVGVPKGSFYHYFKSKEAFGSELIKRYAAYFACKFDKHFNNNALSPLKRLKAFIEEAKAGIGRYDFQRGCLVGKLGQEVNNLPDSFRLQLVAVFADWQQRFAVMLHEAQQAGEIKADLDCARLAAFFWIGWEGAVLQTNLEQCFTPLDIFTEFFFDMIET